MNAKTDRHATRVAQRLHHDRDLQRRFRQEPLRVLSDAGLGAAQVEAVMSGSARDLAAAGIDPSRVQRPPLRHRVRARVLTVVSAVLALLGGPLLAAPASAARIGFARFVRDGARNIRFAPLSGRRFGRIHVRMGRIEFSPPGTGDCLKTACLEVEVMD